MARTIVDYLIATIRLKITKIMKLRLKAGVYLQVRPDLAPMWGRTI